MMRVFGMALATTMGLGLALGATAASAQTPDVNAGGPAPGRGSVEQTFGPYRLEMMTAAWRELRAPYRVRRAQRAADMINSGDCDGARRLVAHDPHMADRVGEACGDYDIKVSDPISGPPEQGARRPRP
ncbi:hypothetical protein BZG35_01590 [Brevundimonas sp. LM2]|uniref:hypothetical protein n=1 Tax=Brevundimonas sp. LM2 TaxID=1938605 RepID=UPI000983B43D|nr:hypothetical protein [Brevundimonas sp. LM2]AQR60491.1 hypothetical protein BZG35_01590 [Brevundimonas sp. LM2]